MQTSIASIDTRKYHRKLNEENKSLRKEVAEGQAENNALRKDKSALTKFATEVNCSWVSLSILF